MNIIYLGTSDEVDTCDCCGRSDLKSTVALQIGEDETAVHYGVVCATRALNETAKEIKKQTKRADEQKEQLAQSIRDEKHKKFRIEWETFLVNHGQGKCTFTRIESLGGYTVAKRLFEEYKSKK